MNRQTTIDTYWMEFMQFYRDMQHAAKQEENEMFADGGMDMLKMMEMATDPKAIEKMQHAAIFDKFKTPDEPTFWMWYATYHMKVGGAE
jgi:hypothetical protein